MNISDRLVGSRSRECVAQFYQTRLVRITHGAFAIWLDPFGMLDGEGRRESVAEAQCGGNRATPLGGIVVLPLVHATTKQGYSRGRHAPACDVRDAEPTRSLCGAGVPATRRAVRFA
jgi:hypothetical protein